MEATLADGDGPLTAECQLDVARGREPVLIAWLLSPMKDDHGAIIGAVGVGRDLTERRKLEFQLRQSHKLAALGVMAGGIAHEIRNPLAVCSSAAQFLMEDDLPEDFRVECMEKIQTGLGKVSQIIENMLRFARPSPSEEMAEVDLVARPWCWWITRHWCRRSVFAPRFRPARCSCGASLHCCSRCSRTFS